MVDLPEYESVPLLRSPLVLVAAQINFEDVGPDITHKQARDVQRELGATWTRLQAAPQIRTTFTPSGAVTEPNRGAYRLTSGDEALSLVINPDSVILETRAYTGWADMSERLYSIADAVASRLDPAQRLRIGLRYVDQVPMPDDHDTWQGLVPDSLLGVSLDPVFGPRVVGSEHRNLLQLANNARCLFRHGQMQEPDTEGRQVYLLDYDVFDDGSAPFSVDDIRSSTEALHTYAGSLFRASVTDDLYAWLRG